MSKRFSNLDPTRKCPDRSFGMIPRAIRELRQPRRIEGPGLTNPLGADVHLVLRDHGPVQSGNFVDQLSTYGGGCTEAPDGTGTLGDFVCTQPQFAVHEPTLSS